MRLVFLQRSVDITLTTLTSLPLLCVPGLMCNADVWAPVLEHLHPTMACQAIEQGDADSLPGLAQQLLDQAPPHMLLAGHSMGARIVLEAVRLAPDRIHGIALVDTGFLPRLPGQPGQEEARKRFDLLQTARQHGVRAMAEIWVQGMVHPDRLKDGVLMASILQMFERKTADDFERQIHALLNRPDATSVLKNLKIPTALVCGQQDAWSPPSQHLAMQQHAPHSSLHLIPNAGHMAPMEQPEALAQALRDGLFNL
jgi:pimeloyl-ACP methyl ester carboxylesterase